MEAVLNKAQVVLTGKQMKEIKNMTKHADTKKDISVLNNMKFEVSDGILTVTINEAYYTIKKQFEVNTNISASFLVPLDIMKKLKGLKNADTFTVGLNEDGKLEFNKNDVQQKLNVMNVDDYPEQNNAGFEYVSYVSHNDIDKLQTAIISTSKINTKPSLRNVLIRDGKIASTDSHRLYRTKSDIVHDQDIILKSEGIGKLKDVFNKNDNIQMLKRDDDVKFESENKMIIIKQFDGTYPEIYRLVPEDYQTEFTIYNAKEFKQVVKDISNASRLERNNVIKFEIRKDTLTVSAKDANDDKSETAINIDNMQGENMDIHMSGKYICDAIEQIDTKELHFSFVGQMLPITITPANTDNDLSLVLPVRVR